MAMVVKSKCYIILPNIRFQPFVMMVFPQLISCATKTKLWCQKWCIGFASSEKLTLHLSKELPLSFVSVEDISVVTFS